MVNLGREVVDDSAGNVDSSLEPLIAEIGSQLQAAVNDPNKRKGFLSYLESKILVVQYTVDFWKEKIKDHPGEDFWQVSLAVYEKQLSFLQDVKKDFVRMPSSPQESPQPVKTEGIQTGEDAMRAVARLRELNTERVDSKEPEVLRVEFDQLVADLIEFLLKNNNSILPTVQPRSIEQPKSGLTTQETQTLIGIGYSQQNIIDLGVDRARQIIENYKSKGRERANEEENLGLEGAVQTDVEPAESVAPTRVVQEANTNQGMLDYDSVIELRRRGFSLDQISDMDPQEALRILSEATAPVSTDDDGGELVDNTSVVDSSTPKRFGLSRLIPRRWRRGKGAAAKSTPTQKIQVRAEAVGPQAAARVQVVDASEPSALGVVESKSVTPTTAEQSSKPPEVKKEDEVDLLLKRMGTTREKAKQILPSVLDQRIESLRQLVKESPSVLRVNAMNKSYATWIQYLLVHNPTKENITFAQDYTNIVFPKGS